ncbi:MAG: hypothetical protein JSV03_15300 [Planctomycetota bacterium]|nr:MAG: hypothetical protein JSV03_15300 [Planctomycetota bacterium]
MSGKKAYVKFAVLLIAILTVSLGTQANADNPASASVSKVIDLAGSWQFKLDPENQGVDRKWFESKLPDLIKLPGSTDQAGYGTKTTEKETTRLSRVYRYVGPAWYQRDVTIPDKWGGKRITLLLERCHWETRVWVDNKSAGMQDSLCVPHIYDLTDLMAPGKHRLTIRVDNNIKYNVGLFTVKPTGTAQYWAHSVTDETQTNWNGIIGRIALEVTEPVWIKSIQVYPDIKNKIAKTVLGIGNTTGRKFDATLTLRVRRLDDRLVRYKSQHTKVNISEDPESTVEMNFNMGPDVKLWDEFSPTVYELVGMIEVSNNGHLLTAYKKTQFGMRRIGTKGTQFTINDRPTFLRGNLDCCIFPLTGYPAMEADAWLQMFETAKSYGINHIRFHSWCPPEAAFIAANKLGLMFQVETPIWTEVGSGKPIDKFVYAEADRILETYGNHPSFCMMGVGNELKGDKSTEFVAQINKYWKEKDPRHLYTGGSGWPESPTGDYHVLPRKGGPIRLHGGPLGPATNVDYRKQISLCEKPVVAHEISQWCVYPNFKQIEKYTGVLQARNLEAFRDSLAKNHMLDQAEYFSRASGMLNGLLFKAGIETMLRTPGLAGFQLLSLHDFPGQGTALVGTLDAFWDSKGIMQPYQFRSFCGRTVLLLRMSKRVFTQAEAFTADVEIAHFGSAPIEKTLPLWFVRSASGQDIVSGQFDETTIPVGNATRLGRITFELSQAVAPEKLFISVSLRNLNIENHWNIWVYPDSPDVAPPDDIMISRKLDADAKSILEKGGKVLLLPQRLSPKFSQPSSFEPIFWNKWLFKNQDRHLGIFCDPRHPIFISFPTEYHTNWQWWDLLNKSTVMVLDDFDPDFRPLVQVIDDWYTNHRLGILFEANVGEGKIVVSSLDLLNDLDHRPVARQLLSSLFRYMSGEKFVPTHTVDMKLIENLCSASTTPPMEK